MRYEIRPFEKGDYARVLEICVSAFAAIHDGFEAALGDEIFRSYYHDWKEKYDEQLRAITDPSSDHRMFVVAGPDRLLGFVDVVIDRSRKAGEIGLNAVHPGHRGQGIGAAMYEFALKLLKDQGALVACVSTGGDAAHAAARAAYEKVGFEKTIPSVTYFRKL